MKLRLVLISWLAGATALIVASVIGWGASSFTWAEVPAVAIKHYGHSAAFADAVSHVAPTGDARLLVRRGVQGTPSVMKLGPVGFSWGDELLDGQASVWWTDPPGGTVVQIGAPAPEAPRRRSPKGQCPLAALRQTAACVQMVLVVLG